MVEKYKPIFFTIMRTPVLTSRQLEQIKINVPEIPEYHQLGNGSFVNKAEYDYLISK